MKIRMRWQKWGPRVALLAVVVVVVGLYGGRMKSAVYAWVQEQMLAKEAATAAAAAAGKPALKPLHELIPQCQKKGPGYHACMFEAGYAVNAQWTAAHDSDAKNDPRNVNSSSRIDATRDPYRDGPSPVYKVPYWVPRP